MGRAHDRRWVGEYGEDHGRVEPSRHVYIGELLNKPHSLRSVTRGDRLKLVSVHGIAHPLATIAAEDKKSRYAAIAVLLEEWRPARLIVGLPAHLDGVEHAMSRLARKFARELGGRFNLPVELVDDCVVGPSTPSALGLPPFGFEAVFGQDPDPAGHSTRAHEPDTREVLVGTVLTVGHQRSVSRQPTWKPFFENRDGGDDGDCLNKNAHNQMVA